MARRARWAYGHWAEGVDPRAGMRQRSMGEWAAYGFVKSIEVEAEGLGYGGELREVVRLAGVDLREAECFHTGTSVVWPLEAWKPIDSDSELFHLVALLYLSERLLDNRDEFQTCLDALKGSVSAALLERLLRFGQNLSSPDFDDFSDGDHAWVALEKLWGKPKSPLQLVDEIVRSSYFVSYPRRDCEGAACATALDFIRRRITELGKSGPPQLVELFRRLERGVTDCYVKEAVVFSEADWEAYFADGFEAYCCHDEPAWGHLTVAQVKALLSALCDRGGLLTQLVTRRPPNSVFPSHLLVLYDCVTHARLWLLSAGACALVPIYCPFALTYDDLGRHWKTTINRRRYNYGNSGSHGTGLVGSIPSSFGQLSESNTTHSGDADDDAFDHPKRKMEVMVLVSPLGFMERIPSLIERSMRDEALYQYYDWHVTENKPKGALMVPFSSPACPRVKIPRLVTGGLSPRLNLQEPEITFLCCELMVEDLYPCTFWYEPPLKLRYWLGSQNSELEKYESISAFIDPKRPRFNWAPVDEKTIGDFSECSVN